jgi:hypothetical protein
MINFNSDKIIIVCFPEGAGGKFLVNALGLSDSCIFQDANLAKRQLDNDFILQNKLDYLIDKLNATEQLWTDLDLHSPYLFGLSSADHVGKNINEIKYNDIIKSLVELNQHYFFMTAHQITWAEACLNCWPNAQIILFENTKEFISLRKYKDLIKSPIFDIWEKIKGQDWPLTPPNTIDELEALPIKIKNEFESSFGDLYSDYYKELIVPRQNQIDLNNFKEKFKHKIITWDANWYFSSTKTIKEIKNLYDKLNLSNFNADAITLYYELWCKKLTVQLPHRSIDSSRSI